MPTALERLDSLLSEHALTIAVAESLTCGQLALTLGGANGSGEWLRGGVVAYADEVKFEVLGVRPGPVISAESAVQMATGVAAGLRARLGLAVTGVGGPGRGGGKARGDRLPRECLRRPRAGRRGALRR